MCGICGVVNLGGPPIEVREVRAMNDAMRLRGPDDEGVFVSAEAGLGHRRLSIIDLVGGHQPMANEDGRVLCVLNGEIYNFVELRAALAARGHVFRTRSDTEAIVHGYEEWGEDVVERLDGMFALAVWDQARRRLLLARDRFGKKPLCWFTNHTRFVFASTLTAVLRHAAAPSDIDHTSLARYLALEFVPTPDTMVRGIRKLAAGTLLVLDDGREPRERSYFRLQVGSGGPPPKPEEAEHEVRERLLSAVKKRLVADVPLGIFLSGGIDSSSVTWAAAQLGVGKIKTFSVGFADPSFDEREYALEVARHFGTDHVSEELGVQRLLDVVPMLGEILDEPMADPSIVPTYLLSRLARRHVTVALGGDGGDELFGGYPMYPVHLVADRLQSLLRPGLLSLCSWAAGHLPVSHRNLSFDFKVKTTLAGLSYPKTIRNYVWLGAFRPDELASLLSAPDSLGLDQVYAPVMEAYEEAGDRPHLERVLYQDVRLYLTHEILMKVDRASMANSLEVRAPFLDTRLAEYVGRLPLEDKCFLWSQKGILKRAMAGRLPRGTVDRPKKGFGMPVGSWLRGPLRTLAEDLLQDPRGLLTTGLFQRPALRTLLDEHTTGRVDHRKRLWTLIIFALWHQHHLAPTDRRARATDDAA